jgi:hypothetical protein
MGILRLSSERRTKSVWGMCLAASGRSRHTAQASPVALPNNTRSIVVLRVGYVAEVAGFAFAAVGTIVAEILRVH